MMGAEETYRSSPRLLFAEAKAGPVSQWSVNDEATRALTAGIFPRYGGNQAVAPAKALQEGMLALRDQARRKAGLRSPVCLGCLLSGWRWNDTN